MKTIILCTTQKKEDHKFKNICKNHQINLFRGNNKNVLKRFVDCAKKNSIEIPIFYIAHSKKHRFSARMP